MVAMRTPLNPPPDLAPVPPDRLRIGLSSGALYPATPTEDAPARAAALGLRDLEPMLQTPGEYDPAFLARLGASCRAAAVRVPVLHTFQSLHPVMSGYQRRTDEAVALFQRAIDGAAALGASAVLWHGPQRAEMRGEAAWGQLMAVVRELAGRCAAAGIRLAMENVSWCALATVRDLLLFNARLAELPGHAAAAVGYAFDPFQAAEAGANPMMVLAAMEGRLLDVHLSDRREADPAARHLLPGEGDLPWPAIVRAVAAAGFRGPMIVEASVPDETAMARVRDLLSPLIAAAEERADPCGEPPPPGVAEGIALFNRGAWYEAHEVIEHEWHAERRPIRRLYQGILQIGIGLHHARGGNHRGGILLLTDGIAKTRAFLPTCQGIDTVRLVSDAERCLAEIVRLGPDGLAAFDWDRVPRIVMTGSSTSNTVESTETT